MWEKSSEHMNAALSRHDEILRGAIEAHGGYVFKMMGDACCAVEYNCVRWGVTEIPPQTGVAVYERGTSGLLAATRIYDDVEPPAVSDTSSE